MFRSELCIQIAVSKQNSSSDAGSDEFRLDHNLSHLQAQFQLPFLKSLTDLPLNSKITKQHLVWIDLVLWAIILY